ncbi:MAG: ethanolamine utilization protein EutH, partial [Bacillota bacterium]|nr:ethanolamine utilization protein EutH [Bacillota bacterium]
MNIITGIMLVFAIIGFLDKTFSLKLGLNVPFEKGLATMATMIVPIVGVCTVGVEFIQRHEGAFLHISEVMPFDASMIIGVLLAPDLGGYFVSKVLAESHELLILNGVILGTLLGQAIAFQIPVFLATVREGDKPTVLKGFLVGMSVIPVGLLIGEIFLRINLVVFLKQFVPILVICLLVALGLYKIPDAMVKGFMVVGRIIQIGTNLMFLLAVLGIFIPAIRYVEMDSVYEALLITAKSSIIIAGALVMTEIVLKFFRKTIQRFADRIETNEISVISMLM